MTRTLTDRVNSLPQAKLVDMCPFILPRPPSAMSSLKVRKFPLFSSSASFFLFSFMAPIMEAGTAEQGSGIAQWVECPIAPTGVPSRASTSVRALKIPNTGSRTIVWTQENTAHSARNG